MGVSLKTEKRRSHSTVSSFRPWVRRAEGYWRTCQRKLCMEVPVKARRPPSLPLICEVFPDHSSFSVFRETPMASAKNIQFQKAKVLLPSQDGGILIKQVNHVRVHMQPHRLIGTVFFA
jgi:hypothetical protein